MPGRCRGSSTCFRTCARANAISASSLSGGEQQMLSIARALMLNPALAAARRAVRGAGADDRAGDRRGAEGPQARGPRHPAGRLPQGISADLIATKYGFSRDDVDAYAVESQKRAAAAWDDGRFSRSVMAVKDVNGLTILAKDEHMRPATTMQSLARSSRRSCRWAKWAASMRSPCRRIRKSSSSSTCTTPAIRRASSMAPPPCCSATARRARTPV